MIKIENIEVVGWEAAIRGMRNPMNSWRKSDSHTCTYKYGNHDCMRKFDCDCYGFPSENYVIGNNDLTLMQKLCKAGTDHRKFMRFITVTCDITAPLYWWKEYDTYKVGTVANSCSTMHKIHSKEFTLDDFSCEMIFNGVYGSDNLKHFEKTIELLNENRKSFLETKDKVCWYQMIQLLPSSYNQKRTVLLNYEVLTNMYHSRQNHKLDEWINFCKWIETLPYSKIITGKFDS